MNSWPGFQDACTIKNRFFSQTSMGPLHVFSFCPRTQLLLGLLQEEKDQTSTAIMYLYPLLAPCCQRYVFPADNGLICLVYVVLQLWYFAWRGKFKNLLNSFRHVPFWTLEVLTTSSRWHDRCEWCFYCFTLMCYPGPSRFCFSPRHQVESLAA